MRTALRILLIFGAAALGIILIRSSIRVQKEAPFIGLVPYSGEIIQSAAPEPPKIELPSQPISATVTVVETVAGTTTATAAATPAVATRPLSKYEALLAKQELEQKVDLRDEEELWGSVVAVHCSYPLSTGGRANIAGSGVIIGGDGTVVTNNHVVDHGPETECEILFPAFSENTYYRVRAYGVFPGVIIARSGNNYNDVAIIRAEKTAGFNERVAYLKQYYGWVGDPFHALPYPFCQTVATGDKVIHYDWQVTSAAAGGYEALRTIGTVVEFLSVSNNLFSITGLGMVPQYAITNITKKGGASGGLAFNASRDCFLGLISRAAENLAYILYLNHPDARAIISSAF